MAHVLFTWELGDHFGHLVSYRGLIASLLADGHRVSFCAKRLDNARLVYGDTPVALRQAPVPNDDASPVCQGMQTFCEILLNNGFHDAGPVARRVAIWQEIFAADPPDFLIMDYSPTAMLAARREGLPGAVAGNGFTVPPRTAPLPPMRYWEPADRARIEASEARLVAVCNAVAGAAAPLAAFHELYLPFAELLRCFAELDHYPRRQGSEYLGTFPIGDYGIAPPWPDGEGGRVFGYLQPSATSRAVLTALAARGNPACVYCPEYFRRAIDPPAADNIVYLDQPMNIGQAVRECRIAITNASLETTATVLRGGRPVLTLPFTMEKYLIARRVEVLGAGLAVPNRDTSQASAKLDAVLAQRGYARAAERFAERYRGRDSAGQVAAMRARIAPLLA